MSDESNPGDICPSCGSNEAYVGIMFVECPIISCEHYTEQQAYMVKQRRLAEAKIKAEEEERKEAEDNKNNKAKDFVDKFVTAGRGRTNNTSAVPGYKDVLGGYSPYSNKDKRDTIPAPAGPPVPKKDTQLEDDEITPWNYHLLDTPDDEGDW